MMMMAHYPHLAFYFQLLLLLLLLLPPPVLTLLPEPEQQPPLSPLAPSPCNNHDLLFNI